MYNKLGYVTVNYCCWLCNGSKIFWPRIITTLVPHLVLLKVCHVITHPHTHTYIQFLLLVGWLWSDELWCVEESAEFFNASFTHCWWEAVWLTSVFPGKSPFSVILQDFILFPGIVHHLTFAPFKHIYNYWHCDKNWKVGLHQNFWFWIILSIEYLFFLFFLNLGQQKTPFSKSLNLKLRYWILTRLDMFLSCSSGSMLSPDSYK